jgi:branched-chain amino acid transport system ATP-binding protein
MSGDDGAPRLEAVDITVRYGGVVANDRVSLRVGPRQIVGLIGPNGAGKTSFIDALTGFAPASGEVRVDGRRVDGLAPHERRRAGMARTWQAGELFSSLTVRQNVQVAAERTGWSSVVTDVLRRSGNSSAAVAATLADLGLGPYADSPTEDLPLGVQKLVGVARAMVGRPRVVLLDEPAAGLDTRESQVLGRQLRDVARRELGLLLVDHDMDLIFDICDEVYVLDFGRVLASGAPDAIRADDRVRQAYLGTARTRGESHDSARR